MRRAVGYISQENISVQWPGAAHGTQGLLVTCHMVSISPAAVVTTWDTCGVINTSHPLSELTNILYLLALVILPPVLIG